MISYCHPSLISYCYEHISMAIQLPKQREGFIALSDDGGWWGGAPSPDQDPDPGLWDTLNPGCRGSGAKAENQGWVSFAPTSQHSPQCFSCRHGSVSI